MKKIVLVGVILFILIGIGVIGYFIYDDYKLKEDNTKYTVITNKIEVYEKHKLSELVKIDDGKLDKDIEIEENELKKKDIEFYYTYKKRPRKGKISIEVVDTTKPIAILNTSFSINPGDDPLKKIVTGDNYDNDPKKEIIGNYDINTLGSYEVTYKVTDSSNNTIEIPFTLKVIPKSTSYANTKTLYTDVISNYKNDKTKIGIDVSKWQGNIDFQKIKDAGVEFIYIRVGTQEGFGKGSVQDQYFLNNIKKANEYGIDAGIYYYSYATTKEEAKEQALWVIDQIKDYEVKLPIAFDWESFSKFNELKMSIHDFNEVAESFLKTLEDNNYEGSLYGSKNYLEKIWKTSRKVWLAHYTKQTTYEGDYYLWQLCNDGKVSGINGYVDIDILYK